MPLRSDLVCHHKNHGCNDNTFIWKNDLYKLIYLEVPKCSSSFIKKFIKLSNITKQELINNYDYIYKDYFIFGIYRNFIDRGLSTYNYFVNGSDGVKHNTARLFKLSINQIQKLSIYDFFNYCLKYKYHHWNSQIKYLKLNDIIKVNLYHINNIQMLCDKLKIDNIITNKSKYTNIILSNNELNLIKKIYKEDYDNINFFL